MLDYVMFTLLSPANGAARASSLGSTQQAGLLIGEEEMSNPNPFFLIARAT